MRRCGGWRRRAFRSIRRAMPSTWLRVAWAGLAFANTTAYRWLSADRYANAMRFGWIPSYPPNAVAQGPNPEPWEWVWIGRTAAACARDRSCPVGDVTVSEAGRRVRLEGWALSEQRLRPRIRVVTAAGPRVLGVRRVDRFDVTDVYGTDRPRVGFSATIRLRPQQPVVLHRGPTEGRPLAATDLSDQVGKDRGGSVPREQLSPRWTSGGGSRQRLTPFGVGHPAVLVEVVELAGLGVGAHVAPAELAFGHRGSARPWPGRPRAGDTSGCACRRGGASARGSGAGTGRASGAWMIVVPSTWPWYLVHSRRPCHSMDLSMWWTCTTQPMT